MKNIDGLFNKERLIKYMVKVNIYYQGHRERTKIDVICYILYFQPYPF